MSDWTLTTEQMIFMMHHLNTIEAAYASDDMAALTALAHTDGYRDLFGDMAWDEA